MQYFSGFDNNLGARSKVRIIPVPIPFVDGEPSLDDGVSPEALQAVADGAVASSPQCRPRALLLTHPHNPFGRLYSNDALRQAVAWASQQGMHVVVDEVRSESQIRSRSVSHGAYAIAKKA